MATGITMLASCFLSAVPYMLLSRYPRLVIFVLNNIALLWQTTVEISLLGAGEF